MQKSINLFIFILFCCFSVKAQVSTILLKRIDTAYLDMKLSSDSQLILGLRTDNSTMSQRVDLRSYSDTSFGSIQYHLPLDGNYFWNKLEVKDSFVYAITDYIQPVRVYSSQSAVAYPVTRGCRMYQDHQRWNDLLFILSLDSSFLQRIYVNSLSNPAVPVLVDSLVVPAAAGIKVINNKLFLLRCDSSGLKVLSYTLSNTAPYITASQVTVLNSLVNFSSGGIDVTGDMIFVKSPDSVYKLKVYSNSVQVLSRKPGSVSGTVTAIDSTTLAYRGVSMYLHDLVTDTVSIMDSLTTFDGYMVSAKLGNNFFYSTSQRTDLRKIMHGAVTSVPVVGNKEDFNLFPNPFSNTLVVINKSSHKGLRVNFYSISGQLVDSHWLKEGRNEIDCSSILRGQYIYRISGNGIEQSGLLVKP
jgi:hypothetical protein